MIPVVHAKLTDWRWLVISLQDLPTHMLEFMPPPPTWFGAYDASNIGTGGVFGGPMVTHTFYTTTSIPTYPHVLCLFKTKMATAKPASLSLLSIVLTFNLFLMRPEYCPPSKLAAKTSPLSPGSVGAPYTANTRPPPFYERHPFSYRTITSHT